jgi:hypothetical protein
MRYLAIYLQDHYAGSTTGLELAPNEPRLDEGNLTRLAERAEDQLQRLHALRGAAALIAFGRSHMP